MYHIDVNYLNQISTIFDKFKQISVAQWNCRCPYCGDSKTSKTKARGYFFKAKDKEGVERLKFYCHNCTVSKTMYMIIKDFRSDLIDAYKFDSWQFKTDRTRVITKDEPKPKETDQFNDLLAKFVPVVNVKLAMDYLQKTRKIPERFLTELYFSSNMTNTLISYHNLKKQKSNIDDPRVIIPFKNEKNELIAIQGRSLKENAKLRYLTHKLDKTQQLIFGLDKIDKSKTIYVVEGPFDSMFLDNSLAVAGTALGKLFDDTYSDYVFIYDNQPRNKEVVSIIEKTIDLGKKVFIWPKDVSQKDINSFFLENPNTNLMELINSRTYSGLSALVEFNEWKKI